MRFFFPCAKGLEYLLADELLALGAERATAGVAGVNAEGAAGLCYRIALWSRLASRALWPLAEFECDGEAALYAGVRALDWSAHLGPGSSLAVDANVSGPGLTHARFAAQRVKDAIVDQFRERSAERPSVDTENPDLRLNLSVRKAHAVLSVDLGGALHRRGWRRAQGEAPLKENLAAAMLIRGNWPAVYADGGGLLDPMCGSGTLPIEAALMAADVAPGLLRYGAEPPSRWRGFDLEAWSRLRAEALERERAGRAALRPVFFGSDADPQAIGAALVNAAAAGLDGPIRFERREVAELAAPGPAHGLTVCNPPYDRRLAADSALYRELGAALCRAVPGWRVAILAGERELAFATGLRAEKTYTLFNGALECLLIVCPQAARAPQPEAAERPLPEGAQMVANRLRKNLRKLQAWREREAVSCFRAYDADLPEYAAAIDVYTEAGGEARTWLHVQEYQAPKDIPEADARRRLGDLLRAAGAALGVPRERIALKTRVRGKGGGKYGRMDRRGEFIVVREGAARLRVNLFDYLDTGLFLDHRPLRRRIAAESAGKRFLNLFAYTGAATVHAALGGAAATTSVDLSATYLDWAAENLTLNGCAGSRHRLVQADVLRWLEAERGEYELIFCDPPTFSNSARAEDFDVQRGQVALLRAAVARLAPGGLLLFSNNFRRFRLEEAEVCEFARVREISAATIDPDFDRNRRIHRAWELRPPA